MVGLSNTDQSTKSVYLSFILSIIILVGISLGLLFFSFKLYKNKEILSNLENKYLPLIDGLRIKQAYQGSYTVFQLFKTFFTVVMIVLLVNYPCQQIQVLLLLNILSMIYLVKAKPFASKRNFYLEIFNESMVSIYLINAFNLTDIIIMSQVK
jgi:hypothetical protein